MLKVDEKELESFETCYPGIKRNILFFENETLPSCTKCGSGDTADVQIGITGRTIYICSATTKIKLIPNTPRPGRYYCNSCNQFFSVDNFNEQEKIT